MLNTLKSIAGFLNTKGGTLFIVVEEDKSGERNVCGISEDLRIMVVLEIKCNANCAI